MYEKLTDWVVLPLIIWKLELWEVDGPISISKFDKSGSCKSEPLSLSVKLSLNCSPDRTTLGADIVNCVLSAKLPAVVSANASNSIIFLIISRFSFKAFKITIFKIQILNFNPEIGVSSKFQIPKLTAGFMHI